MTPCDLIDILAQLLTTLPNTYYFFCPHTDLNDVTFLVARFIMKYATGYKERDETFALHLFIFFRKVRSVNSASLTF